jgi:uncharacterized protein with FMN-binding domain
MKKSIIIMVVLVVLITGAVIAYQAVKVNLDKLSDVQVQNVDLSQIPDDTYNGAYSAFPISVEVAVTVENHAITKIDLIKHRNGQGGGAEVIPEKVIESQSLQIDAVSGATYSSKVILKAIEDALLNANQ